MFRGILAFLLLLLLVPTRVTAQGTPLSPVVKAGEINYNAVTGESVLTGHPRIEYGATLLTADELHYNQTRNLVSGIGNFTLTSGSQRILAESGTYDLTTGSFTLVNVRMGEPPYYIEAAGATGTRTHMVLTHASVTYNAPGRFIPMMTADRLIYEPGHFITADNGHVGLGGHSVLALPKFKQSFEQPLASHVTTRAGFRRNLGAYLDFGLHMPVLPGMNLGADVGEYTARGLMFGPSGDYSFKTDQSAATGEFSSGFINDHGNKGVDLLGRPVPENRGYLDWSHQQSIGDQVTLTGQFNWWKDSEILRDFRPGQFYPVQQPDSFFEGVYAGDNYYLSAFTRLDPNNFEIVQQRLPEIRFDLTPMPIGHGVYERFDASYAVLQQDSLLGAPTLRSDRLDSYYGLYRPITPTAWLTITPVVGGRLTYYANATDGRTDYTRWLGEVGADVELRSSGVFNYHNELWQIDGLRHLLTPKLSYRYIPEADKGQPYIPQIDDQVFSTDLQPLDLGNIRNIDQLTPTNTLRLSLDNVLQTRDAGYGSRDLVALNLAADLNFSTQPGQQRWSDVYTELTLTPASWLRFDLYQRLSTQSFNLRELNTSLALIDHDWWTVRFSTAYLQNEIEQYFVEYDRRLNEVWKAYVRFRYDALAHRWDEQSYGLRQNLRNTWNVRYEVSWYEGLQRESAFRFNVAVDLIRF